MFPAPRRHGPTAQSTPPPASPPTLDYRDAEQDNSADHRDPWSLQSAAKLAAQVSFIIFVEGGMLVLGTYIAYLTLLRGC